MFIRHEEPRDYKSIHELTSRAFARMSFGDGTEAPLIDLLRDSGDLTISLVAEFHGQVAGHVAFSPVTIDDKRDGWFGLGPISVEPERQRQGIGRALVKAGLKLLEEDGARGCALIGNPAIYSRFGFSSNGQLTYGKIDPREVQWIVFSGDPPVGVLNFAPAFGPVP
ncbi:MAG: N-acetyltransferase [Mesorhizobium sp.]